MARISRRVVIVSLAIAVLLAPFSCMLYQKLIQVIFPTWGNETCEDPLLLEIDDFEEPDVYFARGDMVQKGGSVSFTKLDHEPVKSNGILHFNRLPFRKRGFTVKQASSYDYSADDSDFNHFISVKEDNFRVFEDYGPGCIQRMYLEVPPRTSPEDVHTWYFVVEIDGEIAMNRTIKQMITGVHYPYVMPLAGFNNFVHGAYNYVPIFYKKSCIITLNSRGKKFPEGKDPNVFEGLAIHYVFTYHKFNFVMAPNDPEVFQGSEEDIAEIITETRKSWVSGLPSDLLEDSSASVYQKHSYVVKHGENVIVNHKFPGTFNTFQMKLLTDDPIFFKELRLKILWDGNSKPHVDVPFGAFFLTENGEYSSRSHTVGYDSKEGGYCMFPMPFWSSVKIIIENPLKKEAKLQFLFMIGEIVYPKEDVGYFSATWHEAKPYAKGELYPMFQDNSNRWGHVVGLFLLTRRNITENGQDAPISGDEIFYIDDEDSTSYHGISSNGYFNTALHFETTNKFSLPYHGNPFYWKESFKNYNVHAYRMHIADFIPYQNKLLMGIETAPGINGWSQGNYSSLAFHYSGTTPGMVLTDEIDVGDKDSEKSHEYDCDECEPTGTTSGKYYGVRSREKDTVDSGYKIKKSSSFKIQIDPKNTGVLLRRRMDHHFQNQKGKVFVNNNFVGIWFEEKSNTFFTFRNSDFWIPKDFVSGKDSVYIRIDVIYEGEKEGNSDLWSEYRYWVFSEI